MNQDFKKILQKIKAYYGITQSEIAKRINVTPQYLSDIVGGRAPFSEILKKNIMAEFPDVDYGADSALSVVESAITSYMRSHVCTIGDLADRLGVSYNAVMDTMTTGFNTETARKWSDTFGFNPNFLLTGEGDIMKSEYKVVPLLPVSAHAGQLQAFSGSVSEYECEKIVSPLKDAEMAISIIGESMYPELPSGSVVFIKKINEKSFIEWGKPYVLDTTNGTVVKYLTQGREGYVKCVSANPNPIYAPFEVKMDEIFGIYRIVCVLCNK